MSVQLQNPGRRTPLSLSGGGLQTTGSNKNSKQTKQSDTDSSENVVGKIETNKPEEKKSSAVNPEANNTVSDKKVKKHDKKISNGNSNNDNKEKEKPAISKKSEDKSEKNDKNNQRSKKDSKSKENSDIKKNEEQKQSAVKNEKNGKQTKITTFVKENKVEDEKEISDNKPLEKETPQVVPETEQALTENNEMVVEQELAKDILPDEKEEKPIPSATESKVNEPHEENVQKEAEVDPVILENEKTEVSPIKQTDDKKMDTAETSIFENKEHVVSSTPSKTNFQPSKSIYANLAHKKISNSTENLPLVDIAIPTPDRNSCPPSYRAIVGRRSLRPMREYVFQYNNSARESYRKINTELDVGNTTGNTSLNVTVGSEVPSNWSFSMIGRSNRKRERTPPCSEGRGIEMESSPTSPKRARFDFGGLMGIFSSPVSMLRDRLARAKIQSSTPHKLRSSQEEVDVVNVSGISIDEGTESAKTEQIIPAEEIEDKDLLEKEMEKDDVDLKKEMIKPNVDADNNMDNDENEDDDDFKTTEPESRKRGCLLM